MRPCFILRVIPPAKGAVYLQQLIPRRSIADKVSILSEIDHAAGQPAQKRLKEFGNRTKKERG